MGTREPEYGAGAIQTVTAQAEKTPYTELTKDDLKWKALNSTNVETQSFYLISDEGKIASIQVIYNNVAYVPFEICTHLGKTTLISGKAVFEQLASSTSKFGITMVNLPQIIFGSQIPSRTMDLTRKWSRSTRTVFQYL